MKRYFIDLISGFDDVRNLDEAVTETMQNPDIDTREQALAVVADEMREITAADLNPIAEEQGRQDGTYIEVKVSPAGAYSGPEFWVDYTLEDGKLVRGHLHQRGALPEFWDEPEVEAKILAAADEFAGKLPICVRNINGRYGDDIVTGSVEKLAAAIEECGYELPEDGLQEGRDYDHVIGEIC